MAESGDGKNNIAAGHQLSRRMHHVYLSYFWVVFRIIILAWVGLCLLIYFRQSKMVFFPNTAIDVYPRNAGLFFEDIFFRTQDRETLNGWFVPYSGAKITILMCHGNGGNISDRIWALQKLHAAGVNVFIFDYRGYGKSTGNPTESGLYLDARAAWDYLVIERKLPQSNIVIHGRSLGGAVACDLATNVEAGTLILEATFTSLPDIASRVYPYLPVQALCRFRFNTLNKIQLIHIPVLVAHSREDDLIPFSHAESIYQAANEPKSFFVLHGDHNAGEAMDDKTWVENMRTFMYQNIR